MPGTPFEVIEAELHLRPARQLASRRARDAEGLRYVRGRRGEPPESPRHLVVQLPAHALGHYDVELETDGPALAEWPCADLRLVEVVPAERPNTAPGLSA